eukprot:195848-Prorocentrum_minimum.AAC.1
MQRRGGPSGLGRIWTYPDTSGRHPDTSGRHLDDIWTSTAHQGGGTLEELSYKRAGRARHARGAPQKEHKENRVLWG